MIKATLIIPCFNEAAVIERKIKDALKSSISLKEIIVVDDHSNDQTATIVKRIAKKEKLVKYLKNNQTKGKASSVRLAINKAKTDFVCLTDADVLMQKGAIAKMAALLSNKKVGLVSADLNTPGYRGVIDKLFHFFRKTASEIDSTPMVHGQLIMFKKSLGVFPKSKVQADDIDLAIRIRLKGFKTVIAPDSFFFQEQSDKNDFAKRLRRDQGTIKAFWNYRRLLFSSRLGLFGLVCFPFFFGLYIIQPFITTYLLLSPLFCLPFMLKFVYFYLFLAIPFLRNLLYFEVCLLLALIKVFFFKEELTDNWLTERK
jgi:glycosyltransferase involved in cell wall biosynthesis